MRNNTDKLVFLRVIFNQIQVCTEANWNRLTIMAMEKDNSDHASNVAVTAEQATKINDADARSPENRQTGVVPESGSGSSEKGEEGAETAAAAVDDDESGSNSVGEPLPPRSSSSARVPFTNLSQIDSDLALARTLQEQERAYMMLTMNSEISDYGSWETGSYVYEEDEFDDPEDDEDEMPGMRWILMSFRMRSCLRLATLWERRVEGCLLIQLHLCLQKDIRMEKTRTEPMSHYEDDDDLILLPCKHSYHSECINNWLKINKRDNEAKPEITPPHHHALGYPSSTTAPQPVSPPPVQHYFPEPPALTNALLPPAL
ncbi:hypothetical protein HID58_002979 [Brassica napus]|uniref:RING-type domain-containing protein n=2 Tax=Brassica napus TaxID=3708 RepID=A0ABQ8EPZ3_BRANA|nr:hypothetical protein HID58_002979 [Brassica napus]